MKFHFKRSFLKPCFVLAVILCGVCINSSAYAEDTITITLPSSNVYLNITPNSTGVFQSTDVDVQVTTSNTAGYTLSMTAASTYLTRTAAVNGTTPTIPTINTTYSQTNFPTNYWGYKVGSAADFSPITTTKTTLVDTDSSTADTATSNIITFAAKLDNSIPAGDYVAELTFAVVGKVPPFTINDAVYLQDIASLTSAQKTTLLNSMDTGTKYTKTDARDGKSYTIAKLADGNIWMTENLALDLTALTQTELYGTGANAGKMTNASNTTLGYLKGTTSRDPSTDANGNYATAGVSKAWTSSSQNLYSAPMIAVDSTTSGGCNNDSCVNGGTAGSPWSYSDSTSETINGITSRVQGKIGIYYNYCAASAGSYCYGNGTSEGTSSGDATEDICPYGWHLPTGDQAQGSFYYLYNTSYNANYNNFVDALSTPLAGYFGIGKAYSQGSYSYFWSSTRSSNSNMYSLYVRSSSVRPRSGNSRNLGSSVRCLLEGPKTIDSVTTMQDFATLTADEKESVLDSMTEGTQYTKTDARDGKSYTIAKLADGNIWMTQNLDHNIVAQANYYTPENTDIPSAWTPSTATYATGTTTWNTSNYAAPESYDPGDLCWNGTPGDSSTTACGNDKHMSIGNYYNWTAALAMNDSSSYTANNTDVNQSICPAGWRLPIGGTTNTSSKSFQYLVNQASLTDGTSGNIQLSPNYFVYGGLWYGSSGSVGYYGHYWSSVVKLSYATYSLRFNSNGDLNPQDNSRRDFGLSLRCVAR